MRIVKKVLFGLVALVICVVIYFMITPRPVTNFLKNAFKEMEVPAPDYETSKQKTEMVTDIDYNSKYKNGKLDIIRYKGDPNVPTIFWIHGGAFVGGDKSDIDKYLTSISSRGYNIVNINYVLAPDKEYPAQLRQIDEAYRFIKDNNDKYKLNLDDVYIAGDSAGGHIASQFTAIQMNKDYSPSAKIKQSVDPKAIRGAVLLCAPFDIRKTAEEGETAQTRFLFDRVGWALFGERDWKDDKRVVESSLLKNVPKKFPPIFVTDGNSGSFEKQGKEFANIMSDKIDVTQVWYPKEVVLTHEYQFLMDTESAQNTFNELINFLNETK